MSVHSHKGNRVWKTIKGENRCLPELLTALYASSSLCVGVTIVCVTSVWTSGFQTVALGPAVPGDRSEMQILRLQPDPWNQRPLHSLGLTSSPGDSAGCQSLRTTALIHPRESFVLSQAL